MAPHSNMWGTVVGRALPLLSARPSPVSSELVSLSSAQTSLQSPLGSPLAALTHMCCFRIKELGTIDVGSGPEDKGGRASESAFAGLSGATGPLLSSHPSLTRGLLSWGLESIRSFPRVARQPHWVGFLRPRAARDQQPPPSNFSCLRSLFHPFPLCLWLSSPISPPWLQRASCDSGIRAKQFPRDGETALSLGSPRLPLLSFPLAVFPPRAPPLVPAVFCRTPTG